MAIYTQLQRSDIKHLAAKYDLLVIDFVPLDGGHTNSNFLLLTQQGKFVLSVIDDKSWEDALVLGRLLEWLADYRFPTTRLLPPARSGAAVLHNEKPVMVKPFIPGSVPAQMDEKMLLQVGTAVARLHRIPAPDFLPSEHAYNQRLFQTIFDHDSDPLYGSWLEDRLDHLKLDIPQGIPRGLVHGDVFVDNLLFENGELKAIIDFEEACHCLMVLDIGMAVVGLCSEGKRIALSKAKRLVQGYQQIRQLTDSEKEYLQLFTEYAAITTSAWRYWKYHIDAPSPENADKHRQMVQIAQMIGAVPQAEFFNAVLQPQCRPS